MARASQAAKVGLFVAFMGAAGYGVYRYVSPEMGGGGNYVVWALIPNADWGSRLHSRVTRSRASRSASLDSIQLQDGEARLNVKVRGDVTLYDNATLGKKATSLLGEAAVVLTPGTPDHRKLHGGDQIHIIISETTTGELLDEVKEIADSVRAVAQQLANSIGTDRGGENMRAILQNLADATDAINKTIAENRELVHDTLRNVDQISANANPQISQILDNVRVVTQDVRELMAQANGGPGEKGELRQTIERLNDASKSLKSTLEHADHVAERIDKGEGTIVQAHEGRSAHRRSAGRRRERERLRAEHHAPADHREPARRVLLPGEHHQELRRAAPAADGGQVLPLPVDQRPAGPHAHHRRERQHHEHHPPRHLPQLIYDDHDRLLSVSSFQYAKRIGPFTGRFGIMESTGGIGLDIHLLQDRFEIVNDLFGFSEDVDPRYRVFVSYEFIKHFWLLGGVDFIFDPTLRDYFLGLQLRFNDEDLKTIFPFSGAAAAGARRRPPES